MREINTDYPDIQQFRIWDEENNKYRYSGGTPMMLSGFFEQTATLHTVHMMPYERRTPLFDNKNIGIWEGDRVKRNLDGDIGVVEMDNGVYTMSGDCQLPLWQEEVEIIGNNHENEEIQHP